MNEIKLLSPKGHVLLIEKTEANYITDNTEDDSVFISRERSVETYAAWMEPFELISTIEQVVEPTYGNTNPGTCMLFRSNLAG